MSLCNCSAFLYDGICSGKHLKAHGNLAFESRSTDYFQKQKLKKGKYNRYWLLIKSKPKSTKGKNVITKQNQVPEAVIESYPMYHQLLNQMHPS
jgi:hypothetical protein